MPREGVTEHLVVSAAGVRGGTVPGEAAGDWWAPGAQLYDKLHRLAVPAIRPGHTFRVRIRHGFPDAVVEVATLDKRPDNHTLHWRKASSGVERAVMRWYVAELQRTKAEHTNRAGLDAHLERDGGPA